MIPTTNSLMAEDIEDTTQPGKTYALVDGENGGHVAGTVDGIEAVKQAVFRILSTERCRRNPELDLLRKAK